VVCYAGVVCPDEITERFKQAACQWRSTIRLSDEELVDQIKADEIDILVDLSGHTSGNRLMVFAYKPAPVQVTGWGDATGTGLKNMDYLFNDKLSVPEEEIKLYSEDVVYLPCRICYDPLEAVPDVLQLPAKKNAYITFGCFNNFRKLSVEALTLWSEILHEIEDSRLILKGKGLDAEDTQQQILETLIGPGISADRIEFMGGTPKWEHLQACNRVDLALDPFPFGGGTTTLDTLWMGVPVVTLYGKTSVGRASAGILNAVGLREFIAYDTKTYKQIVINTVQDIERLASLRSGLRAQIATTPVGDPKQYAAVVEQSYRDMWRRWCNGVKNTK